MSNYHLHNLDAGIPPQVCVVMTFSVPPTPFCLLFLVKMALSPIREQAELPKAFLDVSHLAEGRSTPPICAGSSVKMLTSKERLG